MSKVNRTGMVRMMQNSENETAKTNPIVEESTIEFWKEKAREAIDSCQQYAQNVDYLKNENAELKKQLDEQTNLFRSLLNRDDPFRQKKIQNISDLVAGVKNGQYDMSITINLWKGDNNNG